MTAVGRVLLGLGLLLGALLIGGCGADGTSTDAAIPEECLREEGRCVEVGIGEPLYLGALLSLDRDSGRDALASVRLAVDYLDGVFDGIDGELLGHRIALVEEDDGCSAAAGRTGALRLLEEPHLLAVIGTTCSSAALGAAARVLGDAGVTMVSPSATAPALTDPEREDRTFFRTVFNDRLQAAVVAEFAVSEQRWERPLAIALEQDAYSEQLAGAFVANAGRLGADADILTVPADIGANALLDAIRRTDPDVLFLPIPDPTCTTLADRIRAAPAGRSVRAGCTPRARTSRTSVIRPSTPARSARPTDARRGWSPAVRSTSPASTPRTCCWVPSAGPRSACPVARSSSTANACDRPCWISTDIRDSPVP
jgi:ABC-type branched-subunit amino acid transport system substrate-binding protein